MKTILGFFLAIGLLVLGGFYYLKRVSAEGSSSFRIAAIKRGELLSTITANGSLQPEETIDVGAQVTGMIKELGPDPKSPTKRVDYGSHVEKGQILAVVDPTVYQAQVQQSQTS
jgi:HlyD family secretion protein